MFLDKFEPDSREFTLEAVRFDGMLLKLAKEEYREDPYIALEAVRSDRRALQFSLIPIISSVIYSNLAVPGASVPICSVTSLKLMDSLVYTCIIGLDGSDTISGSISSLSNISALSNDIAGRSRLDLIHLVLPCGYLCDPYDAGCAVVAYM